MKKVKLLFILVLLVQINVIAQDKDVKAIKELLHKQTIAWNSGNIREFMKGYWQDDSLLFIGKNGPKYGYNTTLENYQKGYPDTTAMGKLKFDIIETKRISVDHFFVVGKWHLQRSLGNLEGYFTLLFKRMKGTWFIIADHSS